MNNLLPDKKCKYCGKSIKKIDHPTCSKNYWKTRKFCNHSCYVKWRLSRIVNDTKKCLQCGKFIKRINLINHTRRIWAKRIFCSRRCCGDWKARKRKKKRCIFCKHIFYVPNCDKQRKFCSNKCFNNWQMGKYFQKSKYKEKIDRGPKKCIQCNKIIYKTDYSSSRIMWEKRKFCSKKCMGKWMTGRTLAEIYGSEAKAIHARFTGKTYEEIYGKHRAKIIKKKVRDSWKINREQRIKNISRAIQKVKVQISNSNKKTRNTPEQKEISRRVRLLQVFPKKDTSIEVALQKELRKRKIRFKKHCPLLGQPDLFIQPNLCIFVDGDYWHGYKWRIKKHIPSPKWQSKFKKIMERDKMVNKKLTEEGYQVIRFWEHNIKENLEKCMVKIQCIMG